MYNGLSTSTIFNVEEQKQFVMATGFIRALLGLPLLVYTNPHLELALILANVSWQLRRFTNLYRLLPFSICFYRLLLAANKAFI